MITCKPGTDCTECPKRYEVETERGIEQRCEDSDSGEWIYIMHNPCYSPFDGGPSAFYRCSRCEYVTGDRTNYCPKCGKKMT